MFFISIFAFNIKKHIMKKEDVTYKLLFEENNSNVNQLLDVYDKTPYYARVIYMNNPKEMYVKHRLVVFEEGKDFNIVLFKKIIGISKTNIRYTRESRLVNISYKNGKFYLISNKQVRPLTVHNLRTALHMVDTHVFDYLKTKFTWLNYVLEKEVLNNVAFNTIVTKKIYSFKKAIIHSYNVPYPVGKAVHEFITKNYNSQSCYFLSNLKKNLEYLDNVTSINLDLIKSNEIFVDTLRMAKILGRKINCKWGAKRLKEAHDDWSREITNIIYIGNDREMTIREEFKAFAEYSGFNLLTTTKEMYLEGKLNNHCVATYVNKVESLTSGIYHIDGYTLEIRKEWNLKHLTYGQFRGYNNTSAPTELRIMVEEKIKQFNINVLKLSSKEIKEIEEREHQMNELPF